MCSKDIDYLNKKLLIDKELRLTFSQKDYCSAPDDNIPVYTFKMTDINSSQEMGGINLRVGITENIELYRGNIGFTVFESFRGHHYAGKSCLLLIPFLKTFDFRSIWLRCNTDNIASKKTLEYIGAIYVDTTIIAEDSPYMGFCPPDARRKLRYRWNFND